MPRDLFGDVTHPSISIGNRKWYSVPVSLLSHSIVLAMIIVLPILAAPMLPGVWGDDVPDYIDITVPPPPALPKPRSTETKAVEDPNAAPVVPPDGIKPETAIDFTPVETTIGVIGGPENIDTVLVAPPPPAVKPQEPVRISSGMRTPVKVRGNDPVYPQFAILSKTQGIVIIEATLGADGRMVNARVLRSVPLLDKAALDAVRSWEYTPTLLNGVPVPVIMTITVSFTLSR